MKAKILNIALVIASLIGYLEWGKDNHSFLFEAEKEVLIKLFTDPVSVIHPFTLLPLFGQMVLVITVFQKKPGKILTFIGLGCLGLLLLLMFVIGIMTFNLKILISTFPFLITGIVTIRHHVKSKNR